MASSARNSNKGEIPSYGSYKRRKLSAVIDRLAENLRDTKSPGQLVQGRKREVSENTIEERCVDNNSLSSRCISENLVNLDSSECCDDDQDTDNKSKPYNHENPKNTNTAKPLGLNRQILSGKLQLTLKPDEPSDAKPLLCLCKPASDDTVRPNLPGYQNHDTSDLMESQQVGISTGNSQDMQFKMDERRTKPEEVGICDSSVNSTMIIDTRVDENHPESNTHETSIFDKESRKAKGSRLLDTLTFPHIDRRKSVKNIPDLTTDKNVDLSDNGVPKPKGIIFVDSGKSSHIDRSQEGEKGFVDLAARGESMLETSQNLSRTSAVERTGFNFDRFLLEHAPNGNSDTDLEVYRQLLPDISAAKPDKSQCACMTNENYQTESPDIDGGNMQSTHNSVTTSNKSPFPSKIDPSCQEHTNSPDVCKVLVDAGDMLPIHNSVTMLNQSLFPSKINQGTKGHTNSLDFHRIQVDGENTREKCSDATLGDSSSANENCQKQANVKNVVREKLHSVATLDKSLFPSRTNENSQTQIESSETRMDTQHIPKIHSVSTIDQNSFQKVKFNNSLRNEAASGEIVTTDIDHSVHQTPVDTLSQDGTLKSMVAHSVVGGTPSQTKNSSIIKPHKLLNSIEDKKSILPRRACMCGVCLEEFPSIMFLQRHQQQSGHFICRTCGECLRGLAEYEKHTNEKLCNKFECFICRKTFCSEENLDNHKLREHFKCINCDKCFISRGLLAKHQSGCYAILPARIVEIYACTACSQAFVQKSRYDKHMLQMHAGKKPHICPECGKDFGKMSALRAHRTYTHTEEKKYTCKFCSKGFKRRDHVRIHENIHSENKPFTCDKCGKGFNQKVCLTKHLPCKAGETANRTREPNKGRKSKNKPPVEAPGIEPDPEDKGPEPVERRRSLRKRKPRLTYSEDSIKQAADHLVCRCPATCPCKGFKLGVNVGDEEMQNVGDISCCCDLSLHDMLENDK